MMKFQNGERKKRQKNYVTENKTMLILKPQTPKSRNENQPI